MKIDSTTLSLFLLSRQKHPEERPLPNSSRTLNQNCSLSESGLPASLSGPAECGGFGGILSVLFGGLYHTCPPTRAGAVSLPALADLLAVAHTHEGDCPHPCPKPSP